MDSCRLLEGFLVGARKLRQVERVYDAGCGHGLTGILLAYRFPQIQVEHRPDQFAKSLSETGSNGSTGADACGVRTRHDGELVRTRHDGEFG